MVGPRAADMIMEATLAVKFGLTVDDIIDTVHPFPTFSEAFKHACQAFRREHVDDELLCLVDNRELGRPLGAVGGDCRAAEAEQEHQSTQ